MPYGFKIELDGIELTDKVSRFEITARLDSYCRELALDLADPDLFDTLDFSQLPESPALEVFTRVADEWVSQGKFFIERPTFEVALASTLTGLWGRSESAVLGPPFAVKISKVWQQDTTFFAVCSEMCEAAGLPFDSQYSEIPDFWIPAYTYQAEQLYPIEVLAELLAIAYGEEGAFITTDRGGHVSIKRLVRLPSVADHTITDAVTVRIAEEPEWPDFGNRVKISASGSLAGYGVELSVPNQCLQADGSSRVKVFARVTDQDGLPVENVPVAWSLKHGLLSLDHQVTNTQVISIFNEEVRAQGFYQFSLDFPPSAVLSVYAASDSKRTLDYAAQGVTIDGTTVTLFRRLPHCDKALVVTYRVAGVAVNYLTAGTRAGTDKLTADVSGNQGTEDLHLDNPCACPLTLRLKANPTSIKVHESARILACLEMGGAPITDGRTLFMTISSSPPHGFLKWVRKPLGKAQVLNERTYAVNEITGITQCELDMLPFTVEGVYRIDAEGNQIGPNLYASHSRKTVNLSVNLGTGTDLEANYTIQGAAVNTFRGVIEGTDRITAFAKTSKEEPLEASVDIRIGDSQSGMPGCCEQGLCDVDVQDCPEGSVFASKNGVDDCYPVEELEACEEGKVNCYKNGDIACVPVEECDTTYGGEPMQCPPNTICCPHKSTGKQACLPREECEDVPPGGGDDPYDDDPDKEGDCGDTGASCPDEKSCCEKGGILGCYPYAECDGGGAACPPPADCSTEPTMECLQSRFAPVLEHEGCTCDDACWREYDDYGTTQNYDGGSYRTIDQIVREDYGLERGTPEYWEQFEELKNEALDQCLKECGDCTSANPLVVSGPDALVAPGGYQYEASGGIEPYSWLASGSGASIDANGYLTISEGGCGSITISGKDACGSSATMKARVTNNGKWELFDTCTKVVYAPGCPSQADCCSEGMDLAFTWDESISGDEMRQEYLVPTYGCPECEATTCGECRWFCTNTGPCAPGTGAKTWYYAVETARVYKWVC